VALAIEKAGEATGTAIWDNIRDVANAPGKEVNDIGEALQLIREGKDINYQGASGEITFDKNGDVFGEYAIFSIADDGSVELGEKIDLSGPAPTLKPTEAPTTTEPTATPTPKAPGFEAIFVIRES
jgi:hypothetical protein